MEALLDAIIKCIPQKTKEHPGFIAAILVSIFFISGFFLGSQWSQKELAETKAEAGKIREEVAFLEKRLAAEKDRCNALEEKLKGSSTSTNNWHEDHPSDPPKKHELNATIDDTPKQPLAVLGKASQDTKPLQQEILPTLVPAPQKKINATFYVPYRYHRHPKLLAQQGDAVLIEASGSLVIPSGISNKHVYQRLSPEGSNVISEPDHRMIKSISYAALLCRFTPQEMQIDHEWMKWKFCGSKFSFIAPYTGYIEFGINRTYNQSIRGQYTISIQIN